MEARARATKSNGKYSQEQMIKPDTIKYSIIGLGVVTLLLLILVITVFRVFRKSEVQLNEKVIKAKDETIKALEQTAEANLQLADVHRLNAIELKKKDSLYILQLQQNQTVYKSLNDRLKNIPIAIQRIAGNDDSIRLAFAR